MIAPTIRLIAIDIDGTLLNSKKEISAENRAAIESARARGVYVALVTGRRYPAARRVAEDLGGPTPLVLHNGSLIVESGKGDENGKSEPLRVRPLSRDTARRVVALGKEAGADPVVHYGQKAEGLLYVETASPSHTLLSYYLTKSHPDVRVVDDLDVFLAEAPENPIQVMFGGSVGEMSALDTAFRSDGIEARPLRTVYPKDDLSLIDIVAPEVDKSEALEFLAARRDIAMNEVLAIGDNWNDRDMLQQAGVGCVMANADPELKRLGLIDVPTNDENGVAVAISRFALGR